MSDAARGGVAARLLRAEVVDAAHRHAARGDRRFGRGLGDAEVGDLDAAVGREEDVAGLDVAMDDAPRVRRVERVRDLLPDARDGGRWQRAALIEDA